MLTGVQLVEDYVKKGMIKEAIETLNVEIGMLRRRRADILRMYTHPEPMPCDYYVDGGDVSDDQLVANCVVYWSGNAVTLDMN
jgi:hypothetical protein